MDSHSPPEGLMTRQARVGLFRALTNPVIAAALVGMLVGGCAPASGTPVATSAPVVIVVTATPQPTKAPITSPVKGGVLKAAAADDFGKLDPAYLKSLSGAFLSSQVRGRLIKLDTKNQLVPDLAVSWENKGGTTWTFHLRQGVKWHSGREFTADDVVYTYERMLDPEVGHAAAKLIKSTLASVSKVDDFTVNFELTRPDLDFPYNLNGTQFHIVPYDETPEGHNTILNGTGPFVLKELVPGERAVLTRNENYYEQGKPYLDGIEVLVMPDRAAQIAALQSGTIDLALEVGFDNYQLLDLDPTLNPAPSTANVEQVIYMDVTKPPFNDQRVRDAIRYLVDRKGLLDAAYYGQGIVSCDTPIGPGLPNRVDDIGICKQDIEKAKQLLAEAGYKDGLRVDLWTLSDRPGFLDVAVALQAQAKAAGVTFEIKTQPANIFWSEMWLKAPIGVSNWGPRPSADAAIRMQQGCANEWLETHYCSPTLDALLDKAQVETDPVKRADLYRTIQEMLATEDGHIIPFFYPRLAATNARVMGFQADATNQHNMVDVWLMPEE